MSSMTMDELKVHLDLILKALRVSYKEATLVKDISFQLVIKDFGVVISGINRADYSLVREAVDFHFKDWRSIYFTTFDNITEVKESIVWELMKSGYMRWVRLSFPRQFNNLIVMEGFGRKIIDQRLKIYNDRSKYKFLIEDNEDAKRNADSYVISIDPGFYDTMPE